MSTATTPTLCYQFPLRPQYLAQIVVPREITVEEAERLCAFIRTLAVTTTVSKNVSTRGTV